MNSSPTRSHPRIFLQTQTQVRLSVCSDLSSCSLMIPKNKCFICLRHDGGVLGNLLPKSLPDENSDSTGAYSGRETNMGKFEAEHKIIFQTALTSAYSLRRDVIVRNPFSILEYHLPDLSVLHMATRGTGN